MAIVPFDPAVPAQLGPCERMRQDPVFQSLVKVITKEVHPEKTRQALSHHTTLSCRLREQRSSAPTLSLAAAGMDQPIWEGGRVRVRLQMDHFLEAGDGLRVVYESSSHESLSEAKRQVAIEYLCMLLGYQPHRVKLPPKCFKSGEASVTRVREAAWEALEARKTAEFDAWAWVVGPLATNSTWTGDPPPPPRGARPSSYVAPVSQPERDRAILDTLLGWQPRRGDWWCAARMPLPQRQFLDANIPSGGLKAWLGRHSEWFTVYESREGIWWTKKVGAVAAEAPLSHADEGGVATAAPAAGGPAEAAPVAAQVDTWESWGWSWGQGWDAHRGWWDWAGGTWAADQDQGERWARLSP